MQKNMKLPLVDEWKPTQSDIIFTNAKNLILAPISSMYHLDEKGGNKINLFMINPKKSYNSDDLRNHCCHYLNYFEKYFDLEKEYFTNMAQIKVLIDSYPEYNFDNFLYDINRYILQETIFRKVYDMVEYNYYLSLSYKSANNPQLQYTNEHAKTLMIQSILMNLCIPLITHFAYMRRVTDIDEFLLDVYDNILFARPFVENHINIASKLYETSSSNVDKNEKNNPVIWGKQDIRGKDSVTHSQSAVRNIILNIMPKYRFDNSMVSLNYTSIQKNNKFQITDIAYEYSYITLSSSKREGEDNTSELDKYEQNLTRTSEALYMQTKVNYQYVMKSIVNQWGSIDDDKVEFYRKMLRNDNREIMNGFQSQLVFNLFYKYFGDTLSPNAINETDYIKLIIIARKMLTQARMIHLPYVISGKVEKIVSRKTLNKKELAQMENSQYYQMVVDKYKNSKIIDQIKGTIATIITSTFRYIDEDPEINGKIINVEAAIIIEEALLYVLLI